MCVCVYSQIQIQKNIVVAWSKACFLSVIDLLRWLTGPNKMISCCYTLYIFGHTNTLNERVIVLSFCSTHHHHNQTALLTAKQQNNPTWLNNNVPVSKLTFESSSNITQIIIIIAFYISYLFRIWFSIELKTKRRKNTKNSSVAHILCLCLFHTPTPSQCCQQPIYTK